MEVKRQRKATNTLVRRQATPKERQLIHLLANLGCSLIRYGMQHANSKGIISPPERLRLAEWHNIRLQQIRRIERRLEPVATLKRVYFKSDLSPRNLQSLKLLWMDQEGKTRVKRVNPELDDILCEALDKGDTLKQIFHTAEVGERQFARKSEKGKVPLWVQEWEESDYSIDFLPPSFPDWVNIVDD